MGNDFNLYLGDTSYDNQLDTIQHFQKFPEMKPWVGKGYAEQQAKLLIVGESHYFSKTATFHHDVESWYRRGFDEEIVKREGHRIRYQISKGFNGQKLHQMYKRLSDEINKSKFFKKQCIAQPLNAISYINYFQRPANHTGKSISYKDLDLDVSENTMGGVINTLKPTLVVFASKKAYSAANKRGFLEKITTHKSFIAHPCSSHWNRACKKYGNIAGEVLGEKTARERFILLLDKYL